MKKVLTVLLTTVLLLQLCSGFCLAEDSAKEVIALPAESATWEYDFAGEETCTSEFVFSPTATMTGAKITYTTSADAHEVTLKVINTATGEALHSSTISVLKGFVQELYLSYTHFETNQKYTLELSAPSEAMASGTITCAANESGFSDISAEDEALYNAARQLQVLGVFDSAIGGTFKPETNITRAEMAKITVAFMNADAAPDAQSPYTDVDASHPLYGYICAATNLGLFCGHGDGTFKPEENITYSELLKIFVHALGYDAMARDIGGYPIGYLHVAADLGLTSGLTITDSNRAATKGDIAILLHTALTKPIMVRTGSGMEIKYTVTDDTILNTKFAN